MSNLSLLLKSAQMAHLQSSKAATHADKYSLLLSIFLNSRSHMEYESKITTSAPDILTLYDL